MPGAEFHPDEYWVSPLQQHRTYDCQVGEKPCGAAVPQRGTLLARCAVAAGALDVRGPDELVAMAAHDLFHTSTPGAFPIPPGSSACSAEKPSPLYINNCCILGSKGYANPFVARQFPAKTAFRQSLQGYTPPKSGLNRSGKPETRRSDVYNRTKMYGEIAGMDIFVRRMDERKRYAESSAVASCAAPSFTETICETPRSCMVTP